MNQNDKIMLITYADSLGNNIRELHQILDEHFSEAIGTVHLLPFYPSSGDRGFAPLRYDRVDPAFGNYEDVQSLALSFPLMFDFMVNHISQASPYFQDFLLKKEASVYKNMFIRYGEFWPGGQASREQIDKIYKRKPREPYIDAVFADGSSEKIWCTFDQEQIDLDVRSKESREFFRDTIKTLSMNGASFIRLDAFAYAIKKADTSCFFVEPEIWNLLEEVESIANEYGCQILPEIHEHYTIQTKLADKGYRVYDFALPMLLLHALYTGEVRRLVHWLQICPRSQFTTLDTHDGIGVVDVVDLLSPDEIELTRTMLYEQGANVKKKYSSTEYNNLDIYQINCTYYSALGDDDDAYILARAIQFFAPGVPQVYYVGLLSGPNDIDLLEKTKHGRDINRHYYTPEEVREELKRPVNQRLKQLMEMRNHYEAFNGACEVTALSASEIRIRRSDGESGIVLTANLKTKDFSIYIEEGVDKKYLNF